MKDFLARMTGRKWMGFVIVLALGVYVMGGESVVAKMDDLPEKTKAFFVLFESLMPFLGIVGAFFGFSIGQGNADAAKEKALGDVAATKLVTESKSA